MRIQDGINIEEKNSYGKAIQEEMSYIRNILFGASGDSFIEFISNCDGLSGFINGNYFEIWRARDIERYNREFEAEKYAPGIILFGSDGGGEGYGFDTYTEGPAVTRVPFIGMSREEAAFVCADFTKFFEAISSGN